jgi:hypothetical protein
VKIMSVTRTARHQCDSIGTTRRKISCFEDLARHRFAN